MAVTTGKAAELLMENALETYEAQEQLLPKVSFKEPDGADMQNSGNVIWRKVQQHAPIIEGWDLSNEETGIIQETYPALLENPKNDMVRVRADDMRDMSYFKERGEVSGRQQATELNLTLATRMKNQGSLFYRFNRNGANGFDFLGQAQAIMNERQGMKGERCFCLNDRDTLAFASELSGRETLKGRPEEAFSKGQIGSQVAEFDVFTGSFLQNLAGGAAPAVTVTGDHTFAPEGGSVDTDAGTVTNVDYRVADITVSASGSYNVGDKVTIGSIQSIGLADKTASGQLMTFTIVSKPDATTIRVYPKPIAAADAALSTLELAYANVDTTISDGDSVTRLNTDTSAKTNLFWDKSAVEVLGGTVPAELFKQFAGFKVISQKLSNGLTMYLLYSGAIETMNFAFRIFTWYGVTIKDPSRVGSTVTYSA